jgi:hypothetical protein
MSGLSRIDAFESCFLVCEVAADKLSATSLPCRRLWPLMLRVAITLRQKYAS